MKKLKFPKIEISKDKVETIQAIISIVAIFVGGTWTYNIFIKERRNYPHANIEHEISHIKLSDEINLLIVNAEITNSGNTRLLLDKSKIRIQQIKPIPKCSSSEVCHINQINKALKEEQQELDRFSWPLVFERSKIWKPAVDIEPKEKQLLNFEFVISAKINYVRIYTHFPNSKKINNDKSNNKFGWSLSTYYNFTDNNKTSSLKK